MDGEMFMGCEWAVRGMFGGPSWHGRPAHASVGRRCHAHGRDGHATAVERVTHPRVGGVEEKPWHLSAARVVLVQSRLESLHHNHFYMRGFHAFDDSR